MAIVSKFGGTSLGTAESIQKVYTIVAERRPGFIVISAVSGVTDLLEKFRSAPKESLGGVIDEILFKHEVIIRGLGLAFSLTPWEALLRAYLVKDNLTEADYATILAIGEDISAALFCAFCHGQGLMVEPLEARDVIVTNCVYDRAIPVMPRMRERWGRRRFISGVSYVMQGFIGSTPEGRTSLLGRGGSDYSAALIAELCKASEVQIYTDVAGVYSADPRIVPHAKRLPRLHFEAMQQLSVFGAKVLHPLTLIPCMRAHIPIYVTSTFEPHLGGTHITAEPVEILQAISLRNRQCLWKLKTIASGLVREILAPHVLVSLLFSHREYTMVVTEMGEYDKLSALIEPFGLLDKQENLALITVIGWDDTFETHLNHYGEMLIMHCSYVPGVLHLLVLQANAEDIVRELHEALVYANI